MLVRNSPCLKATNAVFLCSRNRLLQSQLRDSIQHQLVMDAHVLYIGATVCRKTRESDMLEFALPSRQCRLVAHL